MILVIEERLKGLPNQFRVSCKIRGKKTMLSLLPMQQLHMVHVVHPATKQCYHSFDFHHNPHYGVRRELLPFFKWILKANNINFMEYFGEVPYYMTNQITIHNNPPEHDFPAEEIYKILKTYKLKTRAISNYYLSYGYSAEYRSINGNPLLTTSIGHNKEFQTILTYVFPTLYYLSRNIMKYYPNVSPCPTRRLKYAQKMGSNLNSLLSYENISEGFDLSVVYSKQVLSPHCDVMNDWRVGYNFISVFKCSFLDDEIDDIVTVSIICYTRKAIGDHLSVLTKCKKKI
jgi:hypothetical protein